MLMEMNKPAEALVAYEASLQKHRNRFNGLYGAAMAAEKSGNTEKARNYYGQLLTIANYPGSNRPELATAKLFFKSH
jgi:tetratricopeptide (TPR) repeat protein